MSQHPAHGGLLLLIDLQKAIDHPSWGARSTPDAEANQARLLDFWRARGWPVRHVRHDSVNPASTYRPGQIGHEFREPAIPLPGEPVIAKTTNSPFIGTPLDTELRDAGIRCLVVFGVATNNCVEATVRMAGNLGFEVFVVADACIAFARPDWNGAPRAAEDVHAMSLANLDGEYATVVVTDDLVGRPT
jgi:nicotinamidase-related amidase